VALVRALAVEPRVLLLDEPFGALEARVRRELRRELRRLQGRLGVTTVLVTHDQEEALEVADQVAIMNGGRIEQMGAPEAVYEHPASPFVYRFLGEVTLFHGRVEAGRLRSGDLALPAHGADDLVDDVAVGYARPHDIEVRRDDGEPGAVAAIVEGLQVVGPSVRVTLRRSDTGEVLAAELSTAAYRAFGLQVGEAVYAVPRQVRLFPVPATAADPALPVSA
jgi:sulfate transport system ATP-binding protein